MNTKPLRKTDKENAELFRKVVHLTLKIAEKYKDSRAYEAALEGLYVGLKLYSEKNRKETGLNLYISWFVKTSIEHKLGRKTKDTEIWKKKKEKFEGDK